MSFVEQVLDPSAIAGILLVLIFVGYLVYNVKWFISKRKKHKKLIDWILVLILLWLIYSGIDYRYDTQSGLKVSSHLGLVVVLLKNLIRCLIVLNVCSFVMSIYTSKKKNFKR